MKDYQETDRNKVMDLLEECDSETLKQVIYDCNWLLERKQIERNEGRNNGQHTR